MNFLFKHISIGSDHAGYELKTEIINYLKSCSLQVIDFGTYSSESVDYPDFAAEVAKSVAKSETECGIVICGSGIGVSMTANKIKNIRAALCWNEELGKLARQHNNANILALGARFIMFDDAKKIIDAFLSTPFEGGRHIRRIDKIHNLTDC